MAEQHSKKLVQHDILEILRLHTDKEHTLSQNQILERLKKDYGIVVDRKTVRRHLSALREADSEHIRYAEDVIRTRQGQQQEILSNWYYQNDFSEGELRFLIDSVLFSDALPRSYRKALIKKLEGLSGDHFHSIVSKIDTEVGNRLENYEFLLNLENIENAIATDKQVAFCYQHCGIDGKPHPRLNEDGSVKRYVVNPYQIIRAIGHTYLVCNVDGHDDLTHFRIDRIFKTEIIDATALPLRRLPSMKAGMRLSEYLTQHPNLWNGEMNTVIVRCPQYMANDIVDAFGTGAQMTEEAEGMMRVRIRIDEKALLHWVLQFADQVEIVKPQRLREEMKKILQEALKKYDESF
jgi:predicted DNA-binding transcriptional regulator YafY